MPIEEAREDIRVSVELEERVKPLLMEFAQLTMKSQLKKGITNPRYQFRMELTDYTPIFINRPSAKPHQREQLKDILDDYVEHGVLTKIIGSQWGHPILCVEKKCGKLRICTDLRQLNNRIIDKPYSLPIISDLQTIIQNAKYYSNIDLTSAYYLVNCHPETSKILTLFTYYGSYSLNRLPMGLRTSSWHFQEVIEDIMIPVRTNVVCYQDDILIYTKDVDTHLSVLRQVLELLEQNSMLINHRKCRFMQTSIKFLGVILSVDGIRPCPKVCEDIAQFKLPRTYTELRSFIGIINHTRLHRARVTEMLRPLYKLVDPLKKKHAIKWTEDQEKAFYEIRDAMKYYIRLAYYDPKLPL